MAPTIRRLVAGSGARGHWSRSCACSSTVSTSSARRQNWARSRGRTWPRRPRAEAEDKESTSSDDSASFSEQLWSAARQGVQEKETSDTLSVSAASFLNPLDNTFEINRFFSAAKQLYLKQEYGQSLEMYEEVLGESGRYGLNGYFVDQVSPLSEEEPDVMRKDQISARAVVLFNVGCIYTTFGELETAQQFLREAQNLGLSVNYFLSRAKDPTLTSLENPYLPVVGAVQVVSNLKRFISAVASAKTEKEELDYVNAPSKPYLRDLEVKEEMDSSILAIVKRLIVLVVVLSIFGGGAILIGRLAWYS